VKTEALLLERLKEVRDVWYRSNERKAELQERQLEAYKEWAKQVEVFLMTKCEVKK
jgi:citrate lyase beta subunit